MVKEGATVVLGKRRPESAPGLAEYPSCDDEVRRLAAELWGTGRPGGRSLGKGKVVAGIPLDDALRGEAIPPDFVGPWDFLHRQCGSTDLYFLAGSGRAECAFRVSGKEPELWDPVSGSIRDAVVWSNGEDGSTRVMIDLPENGSVFVVFRRAARPAHLLSVAAAPGALQIDGRTAAGAKLSVWRAGGYQFGTSAGRQIALDVKQLPAAMELKGPWDVRFQPGRGAPRAAVFDALIPWEKHPDKRIKYFSGTATYRKTFRLDQRQAEGLVRLRLGKVDCVAEVRLNGKDLGVLWTDPWTVDLTGVARSGENQLEVSVTNLWVNRLIGDAALPPNERLTRTNVALKPGPRDFKPYQGFSSSDPLLPSGLVGPVRLEFGRECGIHF
jgi:hypothetical protein